MACLATPKSSRQWTILRAMRRAGRRVTIDDLVRSAVTTRTIRRDSRRWKSGIPAL